MRRFLPFIYLAILPLIPLWAAVFQGNAIGPFDQIRHMAPWNGPAPDQPWDVLSADGALQFYGWRSMVLDAWRHHEMPLWNSCELAGTPLLANSQSGGFYPPLVVLGLTGIPTQPAITLLAWLHLFLAGFGAYVLARSLGARKGPAAFAGASFELSAFMLSWIGLSSAVFTCCWIPWVLFALRRVLTGPTPWRAAAGLAAATGMMMLAGHLQFAAFGALATLAAWLVLLTEKRWALSTLAAAAILVGVGLSAGQILPVLKFSQFSPRRGVPTAVGYSDYVGGALKPFELANLTIPTALGNPRVWSSSINNPPISAYWPVIVKRGANLMESAVTIGPLALVAFFLVDWRDRRAWFMAAVGAVGLLIALGSPLDAALYFGAPGWSATGSPGRAISLFVLAAPILAAVALSRDKLPAWIDSPKPDVKLGLAFLATLVALGFAQVAALPDEFRGLISDAAGQALPYGLVALAVAAAALYWRNKRPELLGLVPVFVALPLLGTIVQTGKPLRPPATPPPFARVAIANDHWDLYATPHALLPPNTASLFAIHELGGYDSLLHRDTVGLMQEVNPKPKDTDRDKDWVSPKENGNMLFVHSNADEQALAAAGVTEFWITGSQGELQRLPISGPGRASTPNGPARILDEGFDHIVVAATGPGVLTLRDRNMPGWKATINGSEVPVRGARWREVDLPAGPQIVRFNYNPPGLREGGLISGLCIVLTVLMLMVSGYRRK
jgi:hypothetical protein